MLAHRRRPQPAEGGELIWDDLVEQHGLLAAQQDDALLVVHTLNLVRLHQRPLGVAAGLGVGAGGGVDRGEQRHEGELVVVDPDGDRAALVRDVLCRHLVVAAQADLDVAVADKFLPLLLLIAVGELADGLHDELAVDAAAAAYAEHLLEIHQFADVAELLQAYIYRHRQAAAGPLPAGVAHQAGEELREEQGA